MSFDTVHLPSSVIADLYRQSLVVLDDVQGSAVKPAKKMMVAHTVEPTVTNNSIQVSETEKVVIPVPDVPAPAKLTPTIRYMGEFKQRISIVIAEPKHEDILPEDLEFLNKMMAACKLTIADMAIINIAANQPNAQQLWQLMPAKAVLMFDVPASAIGIPFYQPDFKVQQWDSAQFLNAPALATFRGKDSPELKLRKRQLWECLQKIFLEK